MVGALADWFAVTALFRRPLGLPIPHTAIIPTKKDQLGASLGEFVGENFLSEDVVRERLRAVGIGGAARRLAGRARPRRPGHRRAGDRAARRARRCCATPTCRRWSARRSPGGPTRRRSRRASARCWSEVVADGGHRRVVDLICAARPRLAGRARRLGDGRGRRAARPAGRPRFVDRKVGERVYKELLRFVTRDARHARAPGARRARPLPRPTSPRDLAVRHRTPGPGWSG